MCINSYTAFHPIDVGQEGAATTLYQGSNSSSEANTSIYSIGRCKSNQISPFMLFFLEMYQLVQMQPIYVPVNNIHLRQSFGDRRDTRHCFQTLHCTNASDRYQQVMNMHQHMVPLPMPHKVLSFCNVLLWSVKCKHTILTDTRILCKVDSTFCVIMTIIEIQDIFNLYTQCKRCTTEYI